MRVRTDKSRLPAVSEHEKPLALDVFSLFTRDTQEQRKVLAQESLRDGIERLFLSDGSDLNKEPKLSLDDSDVAGDFDPMVARKK